ncbi:YceD family protein [Parafrankia sp. FMc2]|uniref:YceD family protein n=1 Tax=Parafrankia sp. FMc2 TaxID=3233196 RepID=UPI0034D5A162
MTTQRVRRRAPRGPYVLDTRELGRRPGSLRRVETTIVQPSDFGTEMLRVPAGATVALDLRLESVMEGVLVSGVVTAPLSGECGRCLDEVSDTASVEIRELFYYPDRVVETEDEDDIGVLVDDHADIGPVVRDAMVLSLPLSPVCRPDCAGLCVDCGARLDEVGPDHSHNRQDPRWAALSGLAADPAITENKEKD